MGMVYQWHKQSRFPVDAQVAAERLQLIREELGEITPRAVVADARGDSSPLHSCFDWDDATAAEAHRQRVLDLLQEHVGEQGLDHVGDAVLELGPGLQQPPVLDREVAHRA